ncbi:HU family DNA-binding protein [Coxiella burnetii]|uniref:HU family DNA-binding protein n=1 Tax=Coxiella burnetii TaxID=777 RepID=UPI001F3C3B6D|nr:HU family DNA-binding protein [Coxiella burnetii]
MTTHIAEATNLSKKEVSAVLDELADVMHRHLRKGAAGEFTLPGLVKCTVKRKPATKARKGINPFTGEMMTFKAKPARNVVKVRALKRLKEMVE